MCYGNEKFKRARDYCCKKALQTHFFDVVKGFSPDDLEPEWKEAHKEILSVSRGGGLWLWKPYLVLKMLQEMQEGDFLFYADSGTFFVRSPKYIFESMANEDVWVTDTPLIEKQFTKPSLFSRMGCEEKKFTDTRQIQATFIGVRKTVATMRLIEEWYTLCADYDCLTPEEKSATYPDYYVAHREDQSILSLLCKKYGINPHQDPTQYSKYEFVYCRENWQYQLNPRREYPISILLHRTGNVSWGIVCKEYFRIFCPRIIGCLSYHQYFKFLLQNRRWCMF